MFNIFKNINLNYIRQKSISFGTAFLLTSILPITTVVIRGMSEEKKESKIEKTKIEIYDSSCDQYSEISLEELVIGALAGEVPMSWNIEAIKAQTVAIFSYFLYQNGLNSTLDLNSKKGSCINHFAYNSPEKRKERWGDRFEEYEKKAKEAVNAVKNQVLYYDDKPILAMFFSCCYKKTVPCSVAFSQDFPYLTEVPSEEYKFMNLEKDFEISKSDMAEILKERFLNNKNNKKENNNEFFQKLDSTKPENWFKILKSDSDGYVYKLKILDEEITGHNFRHMIGTMKVRSANFVINYDPEKEIFIIKSLGFGHGTGMSQWGAKFMGDQGYTYDKILLHYYPNTEIRQI